MSVPQHWAEPTEDHNYAATPLFRTHKVDNVSEVEACSLASPASIVHLTCISIWPMPYRLMNVGHAVWAYPPIPICYIRSFEGGLSNKIDGSLYFDILPDSLDWFHDAWPNATATILRRRGMRNLRH